MEVDEARPSTEERQLVVLDNREVVLLRPHIFGCTVEPRVDSVHQPSEETFNAFFPAPPYHQSQLFHLMCGTRAACDRMPKRESGVCDVFRCRWVTCRYILTTVISQVRKLSEEQTQDALDGKGVPRFSVKQCTIIPGFLKIFDEILSNACDQRVQDPDKVTTISVIVDAARGFVAVYNDGGGIDDKFMPQYDDYSIPLMLGTMFAGTNYVERDGMERSHAGTNGCGSKLTNIMSSMMFVTNKHALDLHAKRYTWTDNMSVRFEERVTVENTFGLPSGTLVGYYPEMQRFNIPPDEKTGWVIPPMYAGLLLKRVFDATAYLRMATPGPLTVNLNGNTINIPDLGSYFLWHQNIPVQVRPQFQPMTWVEVFHFSSFPSIDHKDKILFAFAARQNGCGGYPQLSQRVSPTPLYVEWHRQRLWGDSP